MSHFSVLVIGPDPVAQLQPYHEFECTGKNDQYVVNVDRLAEARETFSKDKSTRLRATDGTLHTFFDADGDWRPEFSQPESDPLPGMTERRTYFVPAGYEKVQVPTSEVETFEEWIGDYYGFKDKCVAQGAEPDLDGANKYGWYRKNGANEVCEMIDRTNPNKKWDWYKLGGRWTGYFTLKPGAVGIQGEPGLMTQRAAYRKADQLRKCDIDIDAMIDTAVSKAKARYDRFAAIVGDDPMPLSWTATRAKHGCSSDDYKTWPEVAIAAAKDEYNCNPVLSRIKAEREFAWDCPIDEMGCGRDEYVVRARRSVLTPFAVVHEGKWHERGSMGWFGAVSEKKDQAAWDAEFMKLFVALPDDTLLSLYDCHI